YKADRTHVYVADPAFGLIKYTKEEFLKGWISQPSPDKENSEGILLVMEPSLIFYETEKGAPVKKSFSFL
ncbi:MAG: hypothetical protein KDC61_18805, partial [Saprospiraceae bacterium]|nr:hypothetical protein [Saprospiraceae bacterium]